MKPTIGRIVHCRTDDTVISPAIITKVYEDERGTNGESLINKIALRGIGIHD